MKGAGSRILDLFEKETEREGRHRRNVERQELAALERDLKIRQLEISSDLKLAIAEQITRRWGSLMGLGAVAIVAYASLFVADPWAQATILGATLVSLVVAFVQGARQDHTEEADSQPRTSDPVRKLRVLNTAELDEELELLRLATDAADAQNEAADAQDEADVEVERILSDPPPPHEETA